MITVWKLPEEPEHKDNEVRSDLKPLSTATTAQDDVCACCGGRPCILVPMELTYGRGMSDSDSMIERVARAIVNCSPQFTHSRWDELPEEDDNEDYYVTILGKQYYRAAARAAIAAMREPTEGMRMRYFDMMRAAGCHLEDSVFWDATWERSIDAALSSEISE